MTLSAFLKNYLYIPLGGNRTGHHLRNIMITMFLGGLWHGAGWTFIFWGVLHGIYICINHLWRKTKYTLPQCMNWLLTFNAVNIAWIFFRAASFSDALNILIAMFDVTNISGGAIALKHISGFLGIIVLVLIGIDTVKFEKKFVPNYLWLIVLVLMFIYPILKLGQVTQFLYFQF